MAATPNVTRAWKYARQVVAGKIVACKWTKLACQRMLADLKAAKKKSFPWMFDRTRAERVLYLIQLFHHVKGEWASRQEKIYLEDWQCFFIAMIFGWINRQTEYRRFIQALLFVARKNAKTTTAGAIGLTMLTDDGEHGAEVYSGATSEKQAWEVFGAAKKMAEMNEEFLDYYGVQPNASNISVLRTNSKFEPLIGKPGDGANPSCAIHDEFHEHKTNDQVDTMKTGMGSRRQGLQLVITTAGDNTTGPCAQLCDDAKKVLEGSLKNDRFFPLMYCRDDDDAWDSITAMKKANPNLGVSVFREFLDQQLAEARQSAHKQTAYRTKHLNEWVGSRSAYFNIDKWNLSADKAITLDQFADYPVILGIDLATKVDIAALEILFVLGEKEFARFGKYYLPEETIESGVNKHYATWVDQGWLTATPGQMTDFEFIKEDVFALRDRLNIHEVAIDPYQDKMFISQLMKAGVPCVEMPAQVKYFSEPMKFMEGLIRSQAIQHNGDPVYTWMLSNVTAKVDAKDNVYPRKERDENKIDGPVATIMALGRAMNGQAAHDLTFINEPLVLTY
ncbi:MAG: terminase large subunit [Nitrospinaceae bacterium]|nr:terminase large subunit [Nitrospinaceae bacterium]NIR55596.1 terminase large subunit [Nitrospinaceae bacterium]NIS86030.1 terminase large subunit [Nitrospinaceae bacterium]NIT82873.1 terminase large subunit [Nitrospinaceae bacterium]NIU45078.1 terminase large subunit [Nitrospinaceae bacterium]